MALGIIAGWLGIGFLSWWLMKEAYLNEFGKVTLGDRVFFAFMSLVFAPLTIIMALVEYIPSRKKEPRIVRRRERLR